MNLNPHSFNKSPKQRALYHALMESILEYEDAIDERVAENLKKRKPDDADKYKGPSAGSDRGLKRRKISKDTEPSKKAEIFKGTSKSQLKSTGKFAQAEKTVFETGDTQGHQESWRRLKTDISNRTPYIAYNNPQGIIYIDKYKRNMLMRSDELYKFSDGTLTSIGSVLHRIASNMRMDYLPKRDRVI
ncbi:hypothetical protein Tco_0449393 [Tanacetum coccineum]